MINGRCVLQPNIFVPIYFGEALVQSDVQKAFETLFKQLIEIENFTVSGGTTVLSIAVCDVTVRACRSSDETTVVGVICVLEQLIRMVAVDAER